MLLFIVGTILSRKANKMKKLSSEERKETKKRNSLEKEKALVAFFEGVCESLYSSLRVHLGVTNPIVCLILHINQTLRTRRSREGKN